MLTTPNRAYPIPDLPENLYGQLKQMVEAIDADPRLASGTFTVNDAITNTFTDILTLGHNSTGTPAAGLGGSILFNLESSTNIDQNAARIGAIWTDPTHASRDSALVIQVVTDAGALGEVGRFSGTAFEASKIWAGGNSISSGGLPLNTVNLRAVSYVSGSSPADAVAFYARAQSDSSATTGTVQAGDFFAEGLGTHHLTSINGLKATASTTDFDTTADYIRAIIGQATARSTALHVYGVYSLVGTVGSGSTTVTNMRALSGIVNHGMGNITNLRGLDLSGWTRPGGNVPTTSYGIYMDTSIDMGATSWALYSESLAPSLLSGALTTKINDAATNAFTDLLTLGHNSSGTPAASFGGSILFNLESSTTPDQNAARIGALWTTATHASRTSALVIQAVNNAGALAEVARFTGSGNVGVGTSSPLYRMVLYSTADATIGMAFDCQGATGNQQAAFNFFTKGDGTKAVLDAATKGWQLTARGDAFTTSAQQNDLILYAWSGSGTINQIMYWKAGGGVQVGSPTGGDKGLGTLNAVAVYDDNVLLTDWLLDLHYEGKVSIDDKFYQGHPWQRLFSLDTARQVTRDERRLPWMPLRAEFEAERHLGGMVSRLWQGQEQQQLYIFELEERIRKLEGRLTDGSQP